MSKKVSSFPLCASVSRWLKKIFFYFTSTATFAVMNCLVTAGPTYEPLDDVRRLTNFSPGRLGSDPANRLAEHGHKVTLLLGEQATYRGETSADAVEMFSTTADLR